MALRGTLRRWHVWLGWIVGVPLLFWTASGLFMAARPIDEVRGTALRAATPAILPGAVLAPPATDRAIRSLSIEMQGGNPVWIVAVKDGSAFRADARNGRRLAGVDALEARRIARAAYRLPAAIVSATRTPVDAPPLDLRRPRPAWRVAFADATPLYVDADTGAVLALRTRQWRWYDWMWGLHIMDLQTREKTSHQVLIGFAGIALVSVALALVLLPLTGRRRRRRSSAR